MRSTRLLPLLLCVLLPLPAFAQGPEPAPSGATPPPLVPAPEKSAPSEVPAEPEAPRGELIPRPPPPSADAREGRSSRVPLQLLGGTAAAAGAMLLTVGIFALDSQDCDGFFCNESLFFLGMGAGALGLTVGPPTAIWAIGETFDDRGRFWPTLGGGVLGSLASFLTLLAVANRVPPEITVALAGMWPVLTSQLVHELTRRGPARSEPTDEGPRVLPVVGLSPHGGVIGGLVGSF